MTSPLVFQEVYFATAVIYNLYKLYRRQVPYLNFRNLRIAHDYVNVSCSNLKLCR